MPIPDMPIPDVIPAAPTPAKLAVSPAPDMPMPDVVMPMPDVVMPIPDVVGTAPAHMPDPEGKT